MSCVNKKTKIIFLANPNNPTGTYIDKKNLVMGNNDLDITNIIVEKLNKSLPSLNLK